MKLTDVKGLIGLVKDWVVTKPKLLPKYLLDVGHSESQPGAYNLPEAISEFTFNNFVATTTYDIWARKNYVYNIQGKDLIIPLKDMFDLDVIYRASSLTNLVKDINKINPKACISLHCNAFNKTASGTEALYAQGSTRGKELANILQLLNVNTFKLPDRGTKPISHDDRGGYQVFEVKSPVVISEPFFIDNNSDLNKAVDKVTEYSENLIKVFLYCEEYPIGGTIL